ncbi:integrin alpha-PS2 isoform X1 [Lutzomyia longipalpis]|uniref:Putative vitronectin receptor alpha subunit n=1 Tax=Lutzomyia longipalpis TaxID=7200 RepID=A0A7G3B8H5_LUTLO|nr:integrin alpha-PS2 isoform X1 [Lutzomyia longipalpis]
MMRLWWRSVNLLAWCGAYFLLHITFLDTVGAFNVDTVNYVKYEGHHDSMFGFSVALHQESQRKWIIVGAPQADTSAIQPEVVKGGAVYKCDLASDSHCQIIPFDRNGPQRNEQNDRVDTKSFQWFGATVSSSGPDGPVVACAPRYVFHTMSPRKVERVEPVGTCYLAKSNLLEFTEYSPCRTMYWGYHRQGSCQAGFSAAISKNGERVFIGAPGSWYWQGQLYSIRAGIEYPYKPPRYGQYGEGGQIYSTGISNPGTKVYQTSESTASEDDSYLGYSAVSGDFSGDGVAGVAVGMPRGGGLLGKVLIYSWNLTNQQNITGEQIGAYFGYSLAAVDVDGDKLDDLIIGAPMYTEPNNEGKYEMGRVYVMYHNKKFQELDTRDGVTSKGRFGMALTSLGDINLDGFGDFAVGAPYDGPRGQGAVHIFYGSNKGPLPKASQVIYAEDVIGTPYLTTFGFSLAGGVDLDGNQYPDLVVGAYEASKAIVFKSRPVVVLHANVGFETDNKLVSLEERNCTLANRNKVTCAIINSCLRYDGINVPPTIDIEISWVLDSKKLRQPRMFFLSEENRNIRNASMRLSRGRSDCRKDRVYIPETIRDKLTSLEVEMKYNLRTQSPPPLQSIQSRRRRAALEPILDHNLGLIQRDSIHIQKNCGPDNECIPDIRVEIKTVDKFLLGSKDLLTFEVLVANGGEDAFETSFYMTIPPSVKYKILRPIGDTPDTPITCTAPTEQSHLLKCDLGNPFPSGKAVKFEVALNPTYTANMDPSYDFYIEVNSTNPEKEGSTYDNIIRKNVGIWLETDLTITGKSQPEEIHYNISQYTEFENASSEHDLGPQVAHVYDIRNLGPSVADEVEIYLMWPYETQDGQPLMYMLSPPELNGNIYCDPSAYINYKRIETDRVLATKSILKQIGVQERVAGHHRASSQGHRSEVIVEHGGRTTGGRGSTMYGNRRLSEEEKKKLDAEENIESTGDASLIHRDRASQQASAAGFSTGRVGQGGHFQHSWSSSRGGGSQYSAQNSSYGAYGGGDSRRIASAYQVSTAAPFTRPTPTPTIYRSGLYKIDDIPTEEHVNQDISRLSARTETSTASTGRRRMMSQQDGEPPRPDLITGASPLDKAVQGAGHGSFHTATVDLGQLGSRTNVDDEIHRRGQAAHIANSYDSGNRGHAYNYQQQTGGTRTASSSASGFSQSGRQSSSSWHASSPPDPLSEEDDYTFEDDYEEPEDNSQPAGYRPTHHGRVPDRFQHYRRFQRSPEDDDAELEKELFCNVTRCAVLRCIAYNLVKDDNVYIAIRTRLVARTLDKLTLSTTIDLSTKAVARVTRQPFIGEPKEKPIKSFEIPVMAIPEPIMKPDVVPLWVVVVSACAGTLILLLLIYLLYKCGFFNRNRPKDHSQERQPLNRNGNYHGDEHL